MRTRTTITPKEKPNGVGLIVVISGGWRSSHGEIDGGMRFSEELIHRGYTVFAVVHGSQPKYSIPECIDDMHRAVRSIRHNAKEFGIDPDRIGITGASAGGHLSLMQGTAGKPGDPKAKDPIDRLPSSRVKSEASRASSGVSRTVTLWGSARVAKTGTRWPSAVSSSIA